MDYLQKYLDKKILGLFEPKKVMLSHMVNEFSNMGVTLTDAQKVNLKEQLQNNHLDHLTLDISDAQKEQIKSVGYDPNNLNIDFSKFTIERFEQKAPGIISDLILKVADTVSDEAIKEWNKQAITLLKQEQEVQSQFTRHLNKLYRTPLNLLRMLLGVCEQAGNDFDASFRQIAVKENDLVFEVLTLSHLRGCQIGFEILTLLSSGLADGAYARWRTLYEISVITQFIAKHGNDLAERYLSHKVISDYKAADQHQRAYAILGLKPLSKAELKFMKSNRDAAIEKFRRLPERFKDEFATDYGWAAGFIQKKGRERITFTDIEKAVSLQHMRIFVKAANLNVHAGSNGILFRFGSPPNKKLIPTRGSIFGLSEPGQHTAFSIALITATLLLSKPNIDRIAMVAAIKKLRDETFMEFNKVEATIYNNETDHDVIKSSTT